MSWTLKSIGVAGAEVPYLESGDERSAHVALLIHAFPVGVRLWEPAMLPEGWRAVAPALPGFDGAAPPPEHPAHIDDYARAVLALMDRLHLERAVLGGVSMGGYVAFASWRLDRRRWRALILADTRAGADSDEGRRARDRMLETARAVGARGVADAMLPKLLGETTLARRPAVVDRVRQLIEGQTPEGIAAAIVRLRDRPDAMPLLAAIDVPVLIVVGEEDSVTPPAESEQMRARLAHAQIARIPAAGHLACMEDPAAFNAALAPFLSAIQR